MAAGEIFEDGDKVEEFVVVSVGEPTADGDGVLRVEDVRCGGIIDYDCFAEVTADLRQILDVIASRVM